GQSDRGTSRGPHLPGVPVVAFAFTRPALPVPVPRVEERGLRCPLLAPDAVRFAGKLVGAERVFFAPPVAGAADPVPVGAGVGVRGRVFVAAAAVRGPGSAAFAADPVPLVPGGAAPHAGDPVAGERVLPARLDHRAGPAQRHQVRRGFTAPGEKPVRVGAGARGPVLPVEAGRALRFEVDLLDHGVATGHQRPPPTRCGGGPQCVYRRPGAPRSPPPTYPGEPSRTRPRTAPRPGGAGAVRRRGTVRPRPGPRSRRR